MPEVLHAGELEIRVDDHLVLARGQVVVVSVRELDVLVALARQAGRIVSREDLYAHVWKAPMRPDDRSVDVYVARLRAKLRRALPEWAYIHTHFGFGYRFQAELSQLVHTAATVS